MNSKNIFDLISLKNKVSIVTGGAGHLGSAISESLAELGSDIIIIGRDDKKGKTFSEELSSNFNINANFIQADVNSKQSIDSLMKNINKIDILINNAFTWPSIPKIEDTDWDDFEQYFDHWNNFSILHGKKICRNYETIFWWKYYKYWFNVWNGLSKFQNISK